MTLSFSFFLRPLCTLLLGISLAGCATTFNANTTTVKMPFTTRTAKLAQQKCWSAKGRVGIHTTAQTAMASFHWQQQDANYRVELTGPLGTNYTVLLGDSQQVKLQASTGKTYTAQTPERLLQQQVGWSLPVTGLRYWIRGLPVPGVPAQTQFDSSHRLSTLEQQNWRIIYGSYMSTTSNRLTIDLPHQITLDNATTHLRIAVQQWDMTTCKTTPRSN